MFMDDDSIHAFVIDLSHLFSLKCTHLITVTSRSKNGNASDLCLCFRISVLHFTEETFFSHYFHTLTSVMNM